MQNWGLSPRVRGKLGTATGATTGYGPIPAGAGETNGCTNGAPVVRAYPRGCGGNRGRGGLVALGAGLSPRVRGKHAPAGYR